MKSLRIQASRSTSVTLSVSLSLSLDLDQSATYMTIGACGNYGYKLIQSTAMHSMQDYIYLQYLTNIQIIYIQCLITMHINQISIIIYRKKSSIMYI